MTEVSATHSFKDSSIKLGLMLALFIAFSQFEMALANFSGSPESKISRTKKTTGKNTCLIELLNSEFAAGEYVEIVNSSGKRLGVAKASKSNKKSGRAKALVIDGTRNCDRYKGQTVRRLNAGHASNLTGVGGVSSKVVFIIPRYIVSQHTNPGLALNKFITPAYNQKGFGLTAAGIFPRTPFQLASLHLKTHINANFETAKTSPAIDLIKDDVVLGSQAISTTTIDVRGGLRVLFTSIASWAEVGAILYENATSKSTLKQAGQNETVLFQAVRDISGSGFGVYFGYGFFVSNSAEVSLHSGIGLGGAYKTPLIEDGSFTNSSEKLKPNGLPIFAGASLKVPFMSLMVAEIDVKFKNLPITIPLINEETSKAQSETLSFRIGAGLQF